MIALAKTYNITIRSTNRGERIILVTSWVIGLVVLDNLDKIQGDLRDPKLLAPTLETPCGTNADCEVEVLTLS